MPPPSPTEIAVSDIRIEAWPLARPFVISRGSKTEARVIVVEVTAHGKMGRGEAVPYARYAETPESATALLNQDWPLDRQALREAMPAGAARNALDCALWDLEAKLKGRRVHQLAGLPEPEPAQSCFTISVGTPEEMARQVAGLSRLGLFKLKLAGERDAERMSTVRAARPDCRLVADANEAWSLQETPRLLAIAAENRFELIEQPLPAGADGVLAEIARPIPVCADESVHTARDLEALRERYDAVNIKLDKTGGLTEALATVAEARKLGFDIMIGSMVATSLAAAPAMLLAHEARWVDLDGPLLLARDRPNGLSAQEGRITPPTSDLWG
jgi:L-Ala-D/L-Glu epimerase / N-acetyl-D-glutamate racemase